MTEKDILIEFANALLKAIPQGMNFSRCSLSIERQEGMTGIEATVVNSDNELDWLDPDFDYDSAIKNLYTITQTQPPIHTDWNKAVFTLYPDGKSDMEYIWDAEWQAELDKLRADYERRKNRRKK